VRDTGPTTRQAVERSLDAWGVPVAELILVTDPALLRQPYPLRGDLREAPFVARGQAVMP
jgi:hypothetical protein